MFLTGLEELLAKVAAFSAPSAWDKRMTMRKQMTQASAQRAKPETPKKVPFGYQAKPKIDPTSTNVFGGAY